MTSRSAETPWTVVYLGEIDRASKRRLLSTAEALINPITWPEPFGLVMVEALASATPVIAFPHGSVPEIVEPQVNGFSVTTRTICRDHWTPR